RRAPFASFVSPAWCSPFRLRVHRQLWCATAAYTTPFVRNMLSGTFQAARTGKCGAEEPCVMPCPSALNGLHLCEAAIHKHFRARDVRSEERRVGKECRYRWSAESEKI